MMCCENERTVRRRCSTARLGALCALRRPRRAAGSMAQRAR